MAVARSGFSGHLGDAGVRKRRLLAAVEIVRPAL